MARWIGLGSEHLVLGNGTCELIKVLAGLGERLTVPVPSFNEYENATPREHLVRFALAPPEFDLDVDAFAETAAATGGFAVVVNPGNRPRKLSAVSGCSSLSTGSLAPGRPSSSTSRSSTSPTPGRRWSRKWNATPTWRC